MAWSGLYDNEYTDGPHALIINPSHDKPSVYKKIAKLLKRQGHKLDKQLIDDAFGLLAGTTTTAVTHVRIEAQSGLGSLTNLGGVRTIETVAVSPSHTASAEEEAQLENITTFDSQPTYATDTSGNGGGGKAGF